MAFHSKDARTLTFAIVFLAGVAGGAAECDPESRARGPIFTQGIGRGSAGDVVHRLKILKSSLYGGFA